MAQKPDSTSFIDPQDPEPQDENHCNWYIDVGITSCEM
jgi:hypothetical protein